MSQDTSTGEPEPGHVIVDHGSAVLLGRLWRTAIRPHARRLALAGIFMVIVAGTTALTAWLMDPVVNKLFIEQDRSMLMVVSAAVLLTFLIKSLASFAQDTLMAYTGQRIIADTQSRLLGHLLHQIPCGICIENRKPCCWKTERAGRCHYRHQYL